MQEPELLRIIRRYHKLLERYCHRYMLHKPQHLRAVQDVFESLYTQNLLREGPNLRRLLHEATRDAMQRHDDLMTQKETYLGQRMERYARWVARFKNKS